MKRFEPRHRKIRRHHVIGGAGGAAAIVAALGFTMFGIGLSSAAPVGNVGTHYSQSLAGFSLDGNGATVFDGIWRDLVVPPEPSTVAADEVVDGMLLANNVSVGGHAFGMGLVLNDNVNSGACGLGQYTLEAGTGTITLPGQPTLPATDLSPLDYFGAPVCISASTGGREFAYEYNSHRHGEVDFSAGPSSNNWNVLRQEHGFLGHMLTGGAGVMATSGAALAELTLGNNFDGTGVGTFVDGQGNSVFGQGVNFAVQNYDSWQSTLNGGPPSVSNPFTLNTSPLVTLTGTHNSGGFYSEDVP
jgi:hypothetical protein